MWQSGGFRFVFLWSPCAKGEMAEILRYLDTARKTSHHKQVTRTAVHSFDGIRIRRSQVPAYLQIKLKAASRQPNPWLAEQRSFHPMVLVHCLLQHGKQYIDMFIFIIYRMYSLFEVVEFPLSRKHPGF